MIEENRSNSPSNSVFAIVGLHSTRYLTGWFLSCGVRRRRSLTGARQSEPHAITLKPDIPVGTMLAYVVFSAHAGMSRGSIKAGDQGFSAADWRG
jgi:hypothetical protein